MFSEKQVFDFLKKMKVKKVKIDYYLKNTMTGATGFHYLSKDSEEFVSWSWKEIEKANARLLSGLEYPIHYEYGNYEQNYEAKGYLIWDVDNKKVTFEEVKMTKLCEDEDDKYAHLLDLPDCDKK
jgi:hypothetical protein